METTQITTQLIMRLWKLTMSIFIDWHGTSTMSDVFNRRVASYSHTTWGKSELRRHMVGQCCRLYLPTMVATMEIKKPGKTWSWCGHKTSNKCSTGRRGTTSINDKFEEIAPQHLCWLNPTLKTQRQWLNNGWPIQLGNGSQHGYQLSRKLQTRGKYQPQMRITT